MLCHSCMSMKSIFSKFHLSEFERVMMSSTPPYPLTIIFLYVKTIEVGNVACIILPSSNQRNSAITTPSIFSREFHSIDRILNRFIFCHWISSITRLSSESDIIISSTVSNNVFYSQSPPLSVYIVCLLFIDSSSH